MYKVVYTKTFENDFKKLDKSISRRIIAKINELSQNPQSIKPLRYSPRNLQKLCKIRVGDWRILLWIEHKQKTIILYSIEHRDKIYKNLK